MCDIAQVIENAELAGKTAAGSLGKEELDVYRRVRDVFNALYKIRCTGCGYCMPCPKQVNIPGCFAAYNLSYAMGFFTGIKQYSTTVGVTSAQITGPGNCVACGKCESHCPQGLPIIANLKQVRRRMEPLWFTLAVAGTRAFLGKKGRKSSDAAN
jgi:predicted aldo/keto reductase-like oxidoreductase